MLSPHSLISTYPPPEINDYISKYDHVYVHVDLKNVLQSLFVEDVCYQMINNTVNNKSLDSTIFQSVLTYSSYWKRMCGSMGKRCTVFVSTDVGPSAYHRSINKKYKHRRQIKSYYGLHGDDDNKVKQIRDKNFDICNNIVNRVKGLYFFNLEFLESDFLCHYLIHHKIPNPNALHIIASTDKDMYQTLTQPNIIQINKIQGVKRLFDQHTVIPKYVGANKGSLATREKKAKWIKNVDIHFVAAMMALVGDTSDDVPGVKGIAEGKALQIFSDQEMISKLVGTPEELNARVASGGKFFLEDTVPLRKMSNMLKSCFVENDLVTRAYKMISYEMLISWLNKPDMTEKRDWLNYIEDVLMKRKWTEIPSVNAMLAGLDSLNDCNLTEDDLSPLFNGW